MIEPPVNTNSPHAPIDNPLAKWQIFIIVAAGVFMSTLDSSMVNIALPAIMSEFNSKLKDTEWVVLIYLLTITSTLLLWGHLSDRLGRRRIYPTGLIIFASGSLACAYSPLLSCLIGARLIQALGAAMMMSTGPAIIKETFPPGQLGRGLGMISVSVSLGLMTGPILSGFLMHFFSWRAIFFVTVPIGYLFALAGIRLLPQAGQPDHPNTLNWKNVISWIVMLVFLSFAISYAASPQWSGQTLGMLIFFAFLCLIIFRRIEKQSVQSFLPYELLRKRYFTCAVICAILSFLTLFSVLILTPFYLDLVKELPKAQIGLVMMAVPLSVLIFAPFVGYMTDYVPAKLLSTAGLLCNSWALYLLAGLQYDSSPKSVAKLLVLLGAGQAFFLSPNSASVLNKVPRSDTGKSAALLATSRNLGMLLGIGVASLVFSYKFSQITGGRDLKDFVLGIHTDAFMIALRTSFFVSALISLGAAAVSWNRD